MFQHSNNNAERDENNEGTFQGSTHTCIYCVLGRKHFDNQIHFRYYSPEETNNLYMTTGVGEEEPVCKLAHFHSIERLGDTIVNTTWNIMVLRIEPDCDSAVREKKNTNSTQ